MSTSDTFKAVEGYNCINPYEGLPYSRAPGTISKIVSFFSELKSDIFKRKYKRWEHHEGIGLYVSMPEALHEIPDSVASKAVMLSIHSIFGNVTVDSKDLKRFKNLSDLTFGAFVTPTDIASLVSIKTLKRLVIEVKIKEKIPFSMMHSLEELAVHGRSNLDEMPLLASKLKALSIDNLAGFDTISALHSLEYLQIVGASTDKDLTALSNFKSLRVLLIHNFKSLRSTTGLEESSRLSHLVLKNCKKLEILKDINALKSLQYFELRKCPNIDSIHNLKDNNSLSDLYILDCPLIERDKILEIVSSNGIRNFCKF